MFISRTSFYFRKCPAYQYRSTRAPDVWRRCHLRSEVRKTQMPACTFISTPSPGIHTSCVQQGKNLLKKFDTKTKKKFWYKTSFVTRQVEPSTHSHGLNSTMQRKQSHGESARIKILNSLLFKAIGDLLSTPEVSSEIYNLGIEISKVSLARDYSLCRVYWRTSGTHEKINQIQQALDRCAPRIRYLLISHQIMGNVPSVVFLKDKVYAAISEVENLLKVADFGERSTEDESMEQSDLSMKDGQSNQGTYPTGKRDTSKQSNLFGIDHEALMKQILEYKQKRKIYQNDNFTIASTQQQLGLLEDLMKKKINKKKRSKRYIDDDITPEAYLLARYGQEESAEEEEQEDQVYSDENLPTKDLVKKEEKRSET